MIHLISTIDLQERMAYFFSEHFSTSILGIQPMFVDTV